MLKGIRQIAAVAVGLAGLCVAPSIAKAAPDPSVYVGFDAGAHIVVGEWDLMPGDAPVLNSLGTGAAFTLRVGAVPFWALSVEGFATFITAGSDLGEFNGVMRYGAAALVHPFEGWDYAPHLSVGAGGYSHLSGDVGPDDDFVAFVGLGFRGMINTHTGVRVDFQWHFADAFDGPANNVMLTVGLDSFLWIPEPDTDGDGVSNDEDACPNVPGEKWTKGCPDGDGDGIADSADKCPKKAGDKARGGCPAPKDADGDGVPDTTDKCPAEKGKVALAGCPDSDNDGVANDDDDCPKEAGPPAAGGCPDKDGDGITDLKDACPDKKGPANTKGCPLMPDIDQDGVPDRKDMCPAVAGTKKAMGCPDKDNDGIPDEDDKCPDIAGTEDQGGCLPADLMKMVGSIEGLYFKAGKSEIRKRSFKVLDKLAEQLKKHPKFVVLIEGHTDNTGNAADNMTLSQERAAAVKKYLVGKGIPTAQLQTKGFGDTKPVTSNKTKKGRAKNRRVELKPGS